MERENQDEQRQQAYRRQALRDGEQAMRLMLSRFGSGDATFIEPVNVGDPVPRSTPEDREVDAKIADALTSVNVQAGGEAFPSGLDSLDAGRTAEAFAFAEIDNAVDANADVPDLPGGSQSLVSIDDASAIGTPPPVGSVQTESFVIGGDTAQGQPPTIGSDAPADAPSMEPAIDAGASIDVSSDVGDLPIDSVAFEFTSDADMAPDIGGVAKMDLPPIFDGDYQDKMSGLPGPMKAPGVGTKTPRTPLERMQRVREAKAAAEDNFDKSLRDEPRTRVGGQPLAAADAPKVDFGAVGSTFGMPMNAGQVGVAGEMTEATDAIDAFSNAFMQFLSRLTLMLAKHEERLAELTDRLETEDPFDAF